MNAIDAIARSWPAARAHWSPWLALRTPRSGPLHDTVAVIQLGSRQITIDTIRLGQLDLLHCTEALLAHEVGHHVLAPANLATLARLRLVERIVRPDRGSVLPLFLDLVVNERLHRYRTELTACYGALLTDAARADDAFTLCMTVHELFWELPPGSLVPWDARLRARAQVLRETDQLLADLDSRWLWFLHVVHELDHETVGCIHDEPTPEDWARTLSVTGPEQRAVTRARRAGWIDPTTAARLGHIGTRRRALPAQATQDPEAVTTMMASYYRAEAARHLVAPPPSPSRADEGAPALCEPWQPGDDPRRIDWRQSLLQGDELGCAMPVVRTYTPGEPERARAHARPRLELYLDVSASMPDPRHHINPMTLAATVLLLGALRTGGEARVALFASDTVASWDWQRSEHQLGRFLLRYTGGTTLVPFQRLQTSARQTRATRVIVTDADLDHNVARQPGAEALLREVASADPLVLVLHAPDPEWVARYQAWGCHVVAVDSTDELPAVAAGLGRVLFRDPR